MEFNKKKFLLHLREKTAKLVVFEASFIHCWCGVVLTVNIRLFNCSFLPSRLVGGGRGVKQGFGFTCE